MSDESAGAGPNEDVGVVAVDAVTGLDALLALDPKPETVLIAFDLAGVLVAAHAESERQADLISGFQAMRGHLVTGMQALGLLAAEADAPENADLADLALLTLGNAAEAVKRCEADFTEVSRQRETLQGRVDGLEKAAAGHDAALTAETQRANALQGEVTELKAELGRAKKTAAAKVVPAPKAHKLRDTAQMTENPKPEDLLERLAVAPHILVFSDGEREIVALEAVQIEGGAAWMRRGGRVLLREPVRVKPNVNVELAGFALFDRKGKQIAWSALAQPLRIAAGQDVKLDGQALF
ncbi:hypothetical protein HZY97_16190 [Sphingomonas sp. R-74633]|uniref:hypothetical protein n=1 Tax=Sphingomonas sp. R-74633 TaxID=2751188 RepID=UPI0015D29E8E|nr:hypothetical protein [Sphingomonas sp. R-74633]NYT42313.1 hypothetical protein [Sphingomonas sp. R-74633]